MGAMTVRSLRLSGSGARSSLTRGVGAALASVLLAILMIVGPSPAAVAEEPSTISFPDGDQVTVQYGDPWSIGFQIDGQGALFYNFSGYVSATVSGDVETGPTDAFYIVSHDYSPDAGRDTALGMLYKDTSLPPTPVGDYTIGLTLSTTAMGPLIEAKTTNPARLVVQPAPIAVDLRASVDDGNPEIVIVSSKLSGDFIDEWSWVPVASGSVAVGYPTIPNGTWTFSIIDESGAVVAEETITATTGARNAASAAFADLPLASSLTARVTYSVDPGSAANFSVTPATEVTFSTADEPRPLPTASAVAELETPPPGAPSVPLGFVILAALVGAAFAAVVVTTVVRSRRASAGASSAPGPTDDDGVAE